MPIRIWVAVIITVAACALEDDDRCGDDFKYDPELKICRPLPDGGSADSATKPDATESDATKPDVSDDSATEVDSGADTKAGAAFGESCVQQSDCVTDADFCTYNDMTNSGACTYKDCTADSCPQDWSCCTCPQPAGVPFCAPGDDPLVKQFCTCL